MYAAVVLFGSQRCWVVCKGNASILCGFDMSDVCLISCCLCFTVRKSTYVVEFVVVFYIPVRAPAVYFPKKIQ